MQIEANMKDDWIEFSQVTMPQGFSMVQHHHPIVRDCSFTVYNKQLGFFVWFF